MRAGGKGGGEGEESRGVDAAPTPPQTSNPPPPCPPFFSGPAGLNKLVGLHTKTITPEAAGALLSLADATRLRQQAAGWRMDDDGAVPASLSRTWTAKDGAAADALLARLTAAAEGEGHAVAKGVVAGTTVAVDLATPAVGGLSEADFILAAKLNDVDCADLAAPKRQRFWA